MTIDQSNQTILDGIIEALVALGADRDELTGRTTFLALDIDSLDLAELAQIIDERWGVQIAVGDVTDITTVDDIAALVQSRA